MSAFAVRVGIDVRGLRFVDGSGLARANRLTPNQLAALLDQVQRTSWAASFRSALPVAGAAFVDAPGRGPPGRPARELADDEPLRPTRGLRGALPRGRPPL